jgi:hypothetical protein
VISTAPDVVWKVVLMDVNGVELTAALNMTSSRLAVVSLIRGTASVDRLAGESDSEDAFDDILWDDWDEVELGKTTPLVSRLSTSSSTDVAALLNKMTLAVIAPLELSA